VNAANLGWAVACYGAFLGFYFLLYRRAERRGDARGVQWGWLAAITLAAGAVLAYYALTG
jgi:hypothetical protein